MMTLQEYFRSDNQLESGDLVTFHDETVFLVGDATPYHAPSTTDGEIGWDWESAICNKQIESISNLVTYEVQEFGSRATSKETIISRADGYKTSHHSE